MKEKGRNLVNAGDLGVTSGETLVEHNIARAYGKDEYGAYLVSTCSCGWQSTKCYNYIVSLRELVKQERKHKKEVDNV